MVLIYSIDEWFAVGGYVVLLNASVGQSSHKCPLPLLLRGATEMCVRGMHNILTFVIIMLSVSVVALLACSGSRTNSTASLRSITSTSTASTAEQIVLGRWDTVHVAAAAVGRLQLLLDRNADTHIHSHRHACTHTGMCAPTHMHACTCRVKDERVHEVKLTK